MRLSNIARGITTTHISMKRAPFRRHTIQLQRQNGMNRTSTAVLRTMSPR